MKEATGEGSMTLITIVVVVALATAAGFIVSAMATNAKKSANNASTTNVKINA